MAAIIIANRASETQTLQTLRLMLAPVCLLLASFSLLLHSTNLHWPISSSGVTFPRQENLHYVNVACSNLKFFSMKAVSVVKRCLKVPDVIKDVSQNTDHRLSTHSAVWVYL